MNVLGTDSSNIWSTASGHITAQNNKLQTHTCALDATARVATDWKMWEHTLSYLETLWFITFYWLHMSSFYVFTFLETIHYEEKSRAEGFPHYGEAEHWNCELIHHEC